MTIKEINHKPELSIKNATVSLSYDEVRDIANAFVYLLHQGEKDFKPSESELECFRKRKQDFNILFDIVKHGLVTQFTIDRYATPQESTCPADCKGVTYND